MWDNVALLNRLSVLFIAIAVVLGVTELGLLAARQAVFSIKQVRVIGAFKEADPAFIATIARTELRGNFFTLNLEQAQAKFLKAPWVRQVTVRRVWPRALEVSLVEHEAMAYWNQKGLINNQGDYFEAEYTQSLPQLTGPNGQHSQMAKQLVQFQASLKPIGQSIKELTLTDRLSWRAQLNNDWVVDLGREQVNERFARYVRFHPRALSALSQPVRGFDMRYSNGFATQFIAATAAAPPTQANSKGRPDVN
jgi:cell division protein FtsQ